MPPGNRVRVGRWGGSFFPLLSLRFLLCRYLSQRRQDDFVENFCRKLFSYALGRTLLPSDKGTIDAMRAAMAADGYRFGRLVESIVTSPQFLNRRGPETQKAQFALRN